MSWDSQVPYDELPLLPPAMDIETKSVLKATTAARAAVAALDQAARLLPNPRILLNAATILEAQASSEIENIVTTADNLFKYAQSQETDNQATKEAFRYRSALFEGAQAIAQRRLTAGTAARVCTRIMDREMSIRKLPGTRVANPSTGQVVYSPPEGESVIADKLANWEKFIHADDDLDPLVRMAVAHYQFEAIHPFHDGNGRTGRIINILMLIQAGLINEPILYPSRYITRTKNDYYQMLSDVTSEDGWESWILYMLVAVERTATSTLKKVATIRETQAQIHEEARTTRGGRNADFLAVLFEQPYSRISTVMDRCGISRPTAASWLNESVSAGILSDIKLGRDRLFVNDRFLDVLLVDELAPEIPAG
jgi:Fic family protein